MHTVKLEELFASVLRVPVESLTDASSPSTIRAWDSMATMKLVAALEEMHDIMLSTDEVRTFNSIGVARAMLVKRGITP